MKKIIVGIMLLSVNSFAQSSPSQTRHDRTYQCVIEFDEAKISLGLKDSTGAIKTYLSYPYTTTREKLNLMTYLTEQQNYLQQTQVCY